MELKLPTIFLFIMVSILSINQVQAFTVCDLLSNNNVTAQEIQQAVDNGSIQYSDLPGSFQVNIHAQGEIISHPTKAITDNSMPCQQSKPDDSWLALIIMIAIMLSPLILLIAMVRIRLPRFRIRNNNNQTQRPAQVYKPVREGAMPKGFGLPVKEIESKTIHSPHAKFLLALKIIKVKKI